MQILRYCSKRTLFYLGPFFLLWPIIPCSAIEESGLILSGIDTLKVGQGFDFVLQRACTSSADLACKAHFGMSWDGIGSFIALLTGIGLIVDSGKLNLDSIKSAPPDSLMKDDLGIGQPYRIFRIAPDSLQKCVGNCYILKTGPDPRPFWAGVYFAKIKILGFDVIDSASHQVKMRFLWACQLTHARDLTTTSLDTFHLDTPTLNRPNSRFAKNVNSAAPSQYVFKVMGDRFVLPKELVGKVKWLTVWDLRGRKIGRIEVGNERVIEMKGHMNVQGMAVARVELERSKRP